MINFAKGLLLWQSILCMANLLKHHFKYFSVLLLTVGVLACKPEKEQVPDFVLETPSYFGTPRIPNDNKTTKAGIKLGRHLFYEKKLSLDNSISCGSCHSQKHAFSDPSKFSVGVGGVLGKRNSMSISNLMWQRDFFWDGRAKSLEQQALIPITDDHEMQETLDNVVLKLKGDPLYPPLFKEAFGSEEINSDRIAKALAQFERSLISDKSKYDMYLTNKGYVPTPSELNGMNLFFTHPEPSDTTLLNPGQALRGGNCGDCHTGSLTYSIGFRNNGLDTEANMLDFGLEGITLNRPDRGKFKIPSLRNIALTAPYMHDGRFSTLEEVLDHYNEHIKQSATLDPLIVNASNQYNGTSLKLTADEKRDIINFLKILTDSAFINNPDFSDPFIK